MTEIEIKAALSNIDPAQLAETAARLGFIPSSVCCEEDVYFNAPNRDFRKTDEALRLRIHTQNDQAKALITYKGPKQDNRSHTRTELETGVQDAAILHAILDRLDFRPVLTVHKKRRSLCRASVTLCLDEVKGLGAFLELETVVPDSADTQIKESALSELLSLLDALGVSRTCLTQKSYLELLIMQRMSKKSDQGV